MNLRKELIGGVASFVEVGTEFTADGTDLVVSRTVKPGVNLTPNPWYSLGRIIDLNFAADSESDVITSFCPDSGRYTREEEMVTVRDTITFPVREHSEHVYRLLFGIDGRVPAGGNTAVTPFNKQVREIQGFLQLQGRNAKDGVNRTVFDVFVRLKLSAYPGWTPKTTVPEFTAEVIASDLNSQIFMENL